MLTVNKLSPLGFRFECPKIPSLSDWVHEVMVPGLSIPDTRSPSPFSSVNVSGDQFEHRPILVSFFIDENMQVYDEIVNWMNEIAFPLSYDQRKKVVKSEGILNVLNNQQTKNVMTFRYQDLTPVDLSGFSLTTTDQNVSAVSATVSFSYTTWTHTKE